MMRKLITNIVLLGTIGFVLAGCGNKEPDLPPSEGKLEEGAQLDKTATDPNQGGGGAVADLSLDGASGSR